MFERFTDRARRIVVLAQEEARLLDHNYIGTEHLLLGLIHEADGVAAQALTGMGISLEVVRARIEDIIGRGGATPSGHIPFTPRAKKVLELSLREAVRLGHNYIGTEHILLALIREGDGVAAQVLVQLGADEDRVRQAVMQILSSYSGPGRGEGLQSVELTVESVDELPGRCMLCARDVWETDHYVTGEHGSVCDRCVSEAGRALAAAEDGSPRRIQLPRRLFGRPPSDPAGFDAVVSTFLRAFGRVGPPDQREGAIVDGAALAPLVHRIARWPADDGVRVERVRFVDDASAEVRFSLSGRRRALTFEGVAVAVGGTWRVSRATVCQVLERSGIACPEPDPDLGSG